MNPLIEPKMCQTAAEILALAVSELCPSTLSIEGRATFTGFAYDFCFQTPFSQEMLPHIEERMRQIISQDLPITRKEMLPKNAAEFFRSLPRYYPYVFAKEDPRSFVEVFEMENFFDLCPAPYARSTGEVGAIKLLKMIERPPVPYQGVKKQVIRIEGVVAEDRKRLKTLLRAPFLESEHQKYGIKNGYFLIQVGRGKNLREKHRCFWLKKGQKLKEVLTSCWRESHQRAGYLSIATQGNNLLKNHEEFFDLYRNGSKGGVCKVAECAQSISEEGIDPWKGLFKSKDHSFDRAHVFCSEKDLSRELTTCLQFVERMAKIFYPDVGALFLASNKERELKKFLEGACRAAGVKYQEGSDPLSGLPLSGLFWEVSGRFNQGFRGPFLELRKRGEGFILIHSIFFQLEHFIALIIEIKGSDFENHIKDIEKKTKLG